MTATTTTTQALIGRINETRLNAPVLDNDADALLARINAAQAREQAIERAMTRQSSIGLYGHSQSANALLLLSLCGSGNGRLNVTPGQRTFDYFSHINPGHALTNMAGYKVLVFGDMRELGAESAEQHARVGRHAKARGLDAVLCVGEESRHTADAAGGRHFDNKASLYEVLATMTADDYNTMMDEAISVQPLSE